MKNSPIIKTIDRYTRLSRKFTNILMLSVRPTAIKGRITGPKVLINSIPKSGTNLIQELVHNLPKIHGRIQRVLNSSMTEDQLERAIVNIKSGQCVPAHIYFSKPLASAITLNNIKLILVIRDLRDSLLSHISYLESMHVTHPHRRLYDEFKTFDQKLDAYLTGAEQFESWQSMSRRYHEWCSVPNVFIVRFEELMSNSETSSPSRTVRNLSEFLGVGEIDADRLLAKVISKKGLTYNNPGIGKWKTRLTKEQIEKINFHLADDLALWGYPIDQ